MSQRRANFQAFEELISVRLPPVTAVDENSKLDKFLLEHNLTRKSGVLSFLLYMTLINEGSGITLPSSSVMTDERAKKEFYYDAILRQFSLTDLHGIDSRTDVPIILNYFSVESHDSGNLIWIELDDFRTNLFPRMKATLERLERESPEELFEFWEHSNEELYQSNLQMLKQAYEQAKVASIKYGNNNLKLVVNGYMLQFSILLERLIESDKHRNLSDQKVEPLRTIYDDFSRIHAEFEDINLLELSLAFPDFAKQVVEFKKYLNLYLKFANHPAQIASLSCIEDFNDEIAKYYLHYDLSYIFPAALLAVAGMPDVVDSCEVSRSKEFPTRMIVELSTAGDFDMHRMLKFLRSSGDPFAGEGKLDGYSAEAIHIESGIEEGHMRLYRPDEAVFHVDVVVLQQKLIPLMLEYIKNEARDNSELYQNHQQGTYFFLKFKDAFTSRYQSAIRSLPIPEIGDEATKNLASIMQEVLIRCNSSLYYNDFEERRTAFKMLTSVLEAANGNAAFTQTCEQLSFINSNDIEQLALKDWTKIANEERADSDDSTFPSESLEDTKKTLITEQANEVRAASPKLVDDNQVQEPPVVSAEPNPKERPLRLADASVTFKALRVSKFNDQGEEPKPKLSQ